MHFFFIVSLVGMRWCSSMSVMIWMTESSSKSNIWYHVPCPKHGMDLSKFSHWWYLICWFNNFALNRNEKVILGEIQQCPRRSIDIACLWMICSTISLHIAVKCVLKCTTMKKITKEMEIHMGRERVFSEKKSSITSVKLFGMGKVSGITKKNFKIGTLEDFEKTYVLYVAMAEKPLSSGQKWFLRWVFLGFGGYFVLQSVFVFSFRWSEVPFPRYSDSSEIVRISIN